MKRAQESISVELWRLARFDVLNRVLTKLLCQVPDAQVIRLAVETFDATPSKPVLYISGPMTGLPDFNYPAFREAAKALRTQGYEVVDPSEHFEGETGFPRHKYLAADVVALVTKCRAIAFLPGWIQSEGAKLEAQIALDRGYHLYLWVGPASSWPHALMPLSRDELEALLS